MSARFVPHTRDRLDPDLWSAKREAVAQFFKKDRQAGAVRPGSYVAYPHHEHNVVGVGIGRKWKDGKGTPYYAVRVYVRKKLPPAALGAACVPKRIGGVRTDVIEIEPFRALANSLSSARQRTRPVCAGTSVGFVEGQKLVAGTITAIVHRDGEQFVLSNNHVLAFENRLALGSNILQPATLDDGHDPGDRIATLEQFVTLDPDDNALDAAIAKLDAGIATSTRLATGIQLSSTASSPAKVGMRVAKVGRGTGYTEGAIHDLSISAQVDFETGQFTFSDQLMIASTGDPFAGVGDSGSLIVSAGNKKRPVAMLFAGQAQYALATPIDRVLTALNIEIVA